MSEDIRNVPRAVVLSTMINGVLAFAMLLAILFCAGNVDAASAQSQYPIIPILAHGLSSNAGAAVLGSVVIVLQMCASIGCLAASSRMIWSFARDLGVPGWSALSQVNTRTTIPLLGIAGFGNLESTTSFNDINFSHPRGLVYELSGGMFACCFTGACAASLGNTRIWKTSKAPQRRMRQSLYHTRGDRSAFRASGAC